MSGHAGHEVVGREIVGQAIVLGDCVNTDELHPSRFYSLNDATVRSGFLQAVKGRGGDAPDATRGGIIVAGENFGAGSSRETGARVFVLQGVRAIVAVSFARIFFRNVVNLGIPAFEAAGLDVGRVREGEVVRVDVAGLRLVTEAGATALTAHDPLIAAILAAGGLSAYLGLEPRERREEPKR